MAEVYLIALPKCTTGGEKVRGNKLECQKVYLAALPKWKTGGEKVSGYKLQCQKVELSGKLSAIVVYNHLPSLHL
jgi:hypothetical protein